MKYSKSLSSNRSFGGLLVLITVVTALYAYSTGEPALAVSLALMAILMTAITATTPSLLTPLNRWWHGVGELMAKVVNPIILGAVFFLLITPVALIGRLLKRDVLNLRRRSATSYWIKRDPPAIDRESFTRQF